MRKSKNPKKFVLLEEFLKDLEEKKSKASA